jgi:uncharacterized protein YjbI with pentapeptide repeats
MVALGVAFVLWLVLVAPQKLVPAASDTALQEMPSEARWQARDNRLKLQNDARTTLLQGLGGLAVLVGAFFTFRQVQTNRRQLDVAQQGQVTDRFTRAIDQLGHGVLDVRLGGIYALERIAKDSLQDRTVIVEVLIGFIRGHAPWPPTCLGQFVADAPIEKVPPLQVRALDVQAALTVLARREVSLPLLDLKVTDLRRADLTGARLEKADLTGARLEKADLREAQLQEARCDEAQLQDADLSRANLQRARFRGAQLPGATCFAAQLQNADLSYAQLQRANLKDAQMQGVVLLEAQLQGADLGGAQLRRAQLVDAQLEGAHLPKAKLQRAILSGASLEKANLEEADLQGASLGKANLQKAILARANLRQADLTGAQLKGAQASADTAWPTGFDWRAAGVVTVKRLQESTGAP